MAAALDGWWSLGDGQEHDNDPAWDAIEVEVLYALLERACSACADLRRAGFLGIEIEEKRKLANVGVISAQTSRVAVRAMHTDEEVMIAKSVCRVLGFPIEKKGIGS
ncbi:MAG: hypothetical protein M3A44_12680 [Gammaproteobacteria bacterium]